MRFSLSEWRLPLILGALTVVVLVGNLLINLLWYENPKEISLNQGKGSIKPNLPVGSVTLPLDESEAAPRSDNLLDELVERSQNPLTDHSGVESVSGEEMGYEAESQEESQAAEGVDKIPEGYYLYEGKLYPLVRVRKIKLPDGRVIPLKLVRGKKYRILTSWRNPNPRPLTPEELKYKEELEEERHRLIQEISRKELPVEIRWELVQELEKVCEELANLPTPCLGWDSERIIWLRLPGQSEPSEVITIDLRNY
jgi:hypothetical protein